MPARLRPLLFLLVLVPIALPTFVGTGVHTT